MREYLKCNGHGLSVLCVKWPLNLKMNASNSTHIHTWKDDPGIPITAYSLLWPLTEREANRDNDGKHTERARLNFGHLHTELAVHASWS